MSKTYIVVDSNLLNQVLIDKRDLNRNSGKGDVFGTLKELIKRFQLNFELEKNDGTVKISGEKSNMQRLMFFIHYAEVPFEITKR